MSHVPGKLAAIHRGGQDDSVPNAREEAAHELAYALDEAYWARVRFRVRNRPIGEHGENFEKRTARVEHHVEKFNERAVKRARKKALQAGWTKEQLASSGLTDSGSAQA